MGIEGALLKVLDNEPLEKGLFLLHLERDDQNFLAGQYLRIAPQHVNYQREYSIYSGISENRISLLAKAVHGGALSPQLAKLRKGEFLKASGPYGSFLIEPSLQACVPLLFLATGAGISPFRCFHMSYPQMDYLLVHGIRHHAEKILHRDFPTEKVISCISQPENGRLSKYDFSGRITSWLEQNPVDPRTHVFLCGNCAMIHQAFDLLCQQGVNTSQIFTEVYF